MEVKFYYCEKCDNIKFPEGAEAGKDCKCCRMSKYFKHVKIEVEEVKA